MGASADDDLIMSLDRWITTGVAPERVIATKFENDKPSGSIIRTRPLCAYPKIARWNGLGSIDDATQFRCIDP
jgi:feruloyl esterase